MNTIAPQCTGASAQKEAGLDWLAPGDFELTLITGGREELASLRLGPRDFLPMAHCALKEAIAGGLVQPGDVSRVAGLQATEVRNGNSDPVVRQWYLALISPNGNLAKIKEFDIAPFGTRACRESLARDLDPTQTLFAIRKRRERQASGLGPMTVTLDIPLGPAPYLSQLTLVGGSPTAVEPVYIWPVRLLRRFVQFASEHPNVEVLAAVLGRPRWMDVETDSRILNVRVEDIVLVPPELSEPTAIAVNINRQVVQYIRESKAEIESRIGGRLHDLGTLHPHLPIEEDRDAPETAAVPESRQRISAFFSTSDRATMFTKYYLPHQIAMIWNVPDDVRFDIEGCELAAQFQQWCWSNRGTIVASSGFYLEDKGE